MSTTQAVVVAMLLVRKDCPSVRVLAVSPVTSAAVPVRGRLSETVSSVRPTGGGKLEPVCRTARMATTASYLTDNHSAKCLNYITVSLSSF